MSRMIAESMRKAFGLGLVGMAFAASAEVVFRDDFSGDNDLHWKSDATNFIYSATEGVDGSRALVWESLELSKKEATLSYEFPVEFAREYAYRIQARATQDVVGRVWVRIACVLKDGTRAFCLDGRPVINNSWKAQRKSFQEISGETPPMPAGAKSCILEIHVMKPTVGRVVFDDLEITSGDRTIIGYLQSGAYRDEATGGRVRFAAYYAYDPELCPLKDRRAFFVYRNRAGGKTRVPAETLAEDHILATLDVDDFAIGRHLVGVELADATGKTIDRCGLQFSHVKQLPARMVRIDEHHRLIVEGKPFFPMGCYGCGKDAAARDRYAKAGFNCTLINDFESTLRMAERGIKVIGYGGGWYTNVIDRRMQDYGTNRTVIAWYVADELPIGFARRQTAAQRYRQSVDPNRPSFACTDIPKNARAMMASFDIIAADPYPVGNGEKFEICSESPEELRTATFGMRAVWQVPQAFDWHWHRRTYNQPMKVHHFPTPVEFKNMSWQAIAAGAKGLIWYDYDWFDKDVDEKDREPAYAAFKDMTSKIGKYADVFLSVEHAPTVSVDSKDVTVRTWRKDGITYLLVVNVRNTPVSVSVKGDFGTVKPVLEFGTMPKNALSFGFDALGYSFVSFANK